MSENTRAPVASPWAGADYPEGMRPQTALGSLAKDVAELHGVGGPAALLAAVLLDQGRVVEAMDYLTGVVAAREAAREAERERRGQPPTQHHQRSRAR